MVDEAEDDAPERDEDESPILLDRDEELSGRKRIRDQLLDIFKDVEKGFAEQNERANDQMDYWDIYNCQLGPKQFYTGNSKIFVPLVRNACNARQTRFTNQIFPQSGRYVEVTTENGDIPHATIALLEYYVRKAKLRTQVCPPLVRNGDVEGQYNIYVSWVKNTRHVVQRVRKPVEIEGLDTDDDVDDIAEDTVVHGYPVVEVLADSDVLVLPQTSDSLEAAIANGGSVTICRRWSKAKIRRMIRAGEITQSGGEALIEQMEDKRYGGNPNKPKEAVMAAGIKTEGSKHALVYETWTELKLKGKERRLCRSYYGGTDKVLGCKRNPFWSDKLPIISAPVEKVQGAFKGQSKVKPVADMQYFANDSINEGADSAAYAMMPIVMTDPEKNPRVGSMILTMAAIWEADPNSTKFAQFPELFKHGLEIVGSVKSEIFQSLSVNPAAISQQGVGTQQKRNQAQIAAEQQVDILTTADAVTVIEEGILTPMLNRFIELDHQYRDEDLMVPQYGEMGMRANMEMVPPIQFNRRYQFRWFGVEAARNAQQVQQQIAGMNVLRGIPPQQLPGRRINLVPLVAQLVENTFGPRLAPLIFEDLAAQMPVPIDQEDMLLIEGYEVPTHELDDDQAHIQGHAQLMRFAQQAENVGGGVIKKIQTHIFAHMQQMQRKQQAQMQAQQGMPGVPGGAGPGVAGTPRIGAQPGQPRQQGPAGMIHADRMQSPGMMPRKVG